MATREEIREWAKKFLQGVAHNGYYEGLERRMLKELDEQSVVIKGDTLGASHPHLANYFTVEPLIETRKPGKLLKIQQAL